MSSELTKQILNLQAGDHLCLFYEKEPSEQMPALVPFIQEALTGDEQFIYIADDQSIDELGGWLAMSGINVGDESERGRLNLLTRREWRQPGDLDSGKKSLQVRHFINEAAQAGFKGIRFAVEMTWTLGPDISASQLEHWEATINTIFTPGFPGRIVCQYNRSRLSPEVMLAALHTHPLAILGDQVCPNLFYQAPLILNGNGHGNGNGNGNGKSSPTAQVAWMVSQLKRARAAEKQSAELIEKRTQLERESAEHRRAEEISRRLAAIVESSDDAIISKDLNGVVKSWNQGAERLFGYTEQEIIGTSIQILIPQERHDEEPNILNRIRKGERIEHYETVRRRKDGTLVEISLTVSPIRDAQGKIIGASKIARDITDQKRAKQELQEAKDQLLRANEALEQRVQERTASLSEAVEQMEEFSYTVSHDLRAPLRGIQAYSQALIEDHADNLAPEARHWLKRVGDNATRLDKMILDLLTFSRLARGDVRLGIVSLDRLVREMVEHYPGLQAPEADVHIAPLADVLGHEPSLTQVISNLLSNAVKFIAPGVTPRVRIWTEQGDSDVRLWVEDNGIGIEPEYQPRLFNMFERIHPAREYDGTGVGLAIARKAAERMGGKVGMESDGKNGSRFWIQLRAAKGGQ